jgi:hypothetical protein
MPGFCNTQARQRAPSITPGATIAPVGQASRQRRQVPHPSATGCSLIGSGAVVTTQPSTNQLPAPGSRRLAFLPYADAGEVGDLPVDDAVVVGEGHGLVAVGP